MRIKGLEPKMAWMGIKFRNGILPIMLAALSLAGCEFAASTEGDEDPGNRGRSANAAFSTIFGSAGTSTTAATVVVTLQSQEGFPLFNVTPTFTVTPLSANDFGFTCGATNAFGEAQCSFRSFDAGVAKTLVLTSPVSATGNAITFTQSASQIVITTQPDTNFPTGGIVTDIAGADGFVTQPVIELRDPLNVIVATDSSTSIEVTLNTVKTDNTATPTLFKGGAACADPCTINPSAGIVNFGNAGNELSSDIAGTHTFSFAGSGLTTVVSNEFQLRAEAGASLAFTTQPPSSVVPLQAFTQFPAVAIKDQYGNIVEIDPGDGSDAFNIDLTLVYANDTDENLLGNVRKRAVDGVADYTEQGLRIDTDVAGTGAFLQAQDSGATLPQISSNTFEISSVGIPAKLAFTTEPSTKGTTGVALTQQPVVTLQDSDGNTITTENARQVTLNIADQANANCEDDPPSVGGTNSVTMINGVATFSGISITKDATAGCDYYQLSASVGVLPDVNPVSSEVIFVGDTGTVAEQLAFTVQPASTGADQTMASFTVQVQDGLGNLITADNSTVVTLSLSTGTGTLGGTISKTVSGGIANFTDVTISEIGVKILTASANDLTSAVSNSFFIDTSGTASGIEFTATPGTETAGVVFGTTPAVKLIDDNGNDVALGGVVLSISCTNPANCELVGANQNAITDANGDATFSANLRINTSTGNNLQLTATADDASLNINPGSTLTGFTVNAAAANNFNSAITASAPTAVNEPDGLVIVILQDQFGNAVDSATITLNVTPDAGACTHSCGSTNSSGQAECSFECNTANAIVTITINQINGAASAVTKSAVVGMPP